MSFADVIHAARKAAEFKIETDRAIMESLLIQNEAKKAKEMARKAREKAEAEAEWEKEKAEYEEYIKRAQGMRHELEKSLDSRKKQYSIKDDASSGRTRKKTKHKKTKHKKTKHKKTKHKKTTTRSIAGERRLRPITRAQERKYQFEKSGAKKCIRNLFNILGRLAAAKGKVEYLLTMMKATNRDERPKRAGAWVKLLNVGKSYRIPNTEVLKKEIYGSARLESGNIMEIIHIAEEEVQINMEECLEKSEDPQYFSQILAEINRLIVEVVWDNTYIHRNQHGNLVARPEPNVNQELKIFMNDLNESEIPDALLPEITQILSLQPIRVKLDVSEMFANRLKMIIQKAIDGRAAGIVRRGEYGFIVCNSRRMKTLYELTNIYEKQFIELIPFLPSNMFHAVPDGSEDYAYGAEAEALMNERNILATDIQHQQPDLHSSSSSSTEDLGDTSSSSTEDLGDTSSSTS